MNFVSNIDHIVRDRERRKPSVEVGEGRHIGSTWGCKKAVRSRRSKATSYLWLNLFGQLSFASTNKKNNLIKFELSFTYLLVGWTDTGGAEPPAINVKVSFITKEHWQKRLLQIFSMTWTEPRQQQTFDAVVAQHSGTIYIRPSKPCLCRVRKDIRNAGIADVNLWWWWPNNL